jgi:multidrug efflux pump subunit AcrA (membrane-fusion protein)
MPPAYVKPYVKRQKNDATDAEAICEAVTRPSMRFVPTKTPGQQSCLMLHRTRHLFIRQQTAVINSIRALLAEFGVVAPVGRNGVERLLEVVADAEDTRLPEVARACVAALGSQLLAVKAQILAFDRRIMVWHRSNEMSKRLDAIPGVGTALTKPAAVIFTLSSRSLEDVREAMERGPVEVIAYSQDNKRELAKGTLLLIDNIVDQASATMRLKAMFPNEHEELWPGDFVNARLFLKVIPNALTIPSAAVLTGPDGLLAWVVTEGDVVEARPIRTGPTTVRRESPYFANCLSIASRNDKPPCPGKRIRRLV